MSIPASRQPLGSIDTSQVSNDPEPSDPDSPTHDEYHDALESHDAPEYPIWSRIPTQGAIDIETGSTTVVETLSTSVTTDAATVPVAETSSATLVTTETYSTTHELNVAAAAPTITEIPRIIPTATEVGMTSLETEVTIDTATLAASEMPDFVTVSVTEPSSAPLITTQTGAALTSAAGIDVATEAPTAAVPATTTTTATVVIPSTEMMVSGFSTAVDIFERWDGRSDNDKTIRRRIGEINNFNGEFADVMKLSLEVANDHGNNITHMFEIILGPNPAQNSLADLKETLSHARKSTSRIVASFGKISGRLLKINQNMPADITRIDDSKTAYIAGTAVLGVASIACAFLFPPIAVVSFWGAFGAGAVSGLCAGGAVCTGVKAIEKNRSLETARAIQEDVDELETVMIRRAIDWWSAMERALETIGAIANALTTLDHARIQYIQEQWTNRVQKNYILYTGTMRRLIEGL